MNCPNCGTNNLDTASICANCGKPLTSNTPHSYTPPPQPPAGAPIPNYLLQSILVTICCCQPLAIVAIIFSAMVNSRLAAGDTAGALDASSKAKLFCWISFGLAVVGWLAIWGLGGLLSLESIRDAMENR